jgi:hypothetical protein
MLLLVTLQHTTGDPGGLRQTAMLLVSAALIE